MATEAQKLDDNGKVEPKYKALQSCPRPRVKKPRNGSLINNDEMVEDDDKSFDGNNLSSESNSKDNEDAMTITNQELAASLPSKMIPTTGHHSGKQRRRSLQQCSKSQRAINCFEWRGNT
ncbi:hypothetical protein C0991_006794 [Blastosporella zonata]|nr:hypothetical protein C0991_006794 [Blastosporella zonata]